MSRFRKSTDRPVPWTPAAVGPVLARLAAAEAELRRLPGARLTELWVQAVDTLRRRAAEPTSPLRQALIDGTGLSPPGFDAAFGQILDGVTTPAARRLLAASPHLPQVSRRPVAVLTSSNLPALAVQSLLPALAARRPVLIKSPSAEPHFAPAFVEALASLEPALGRAVAAAMWRGGDEEVEDAVFGAVGRVIAYGDGATAASLRRRLGERLLMHGPKLSLAILADDVDPATAAPGLARDIALFDQRGCLSVQAILVVGPAARRAAENLAPHVARHLEALHDRWPPGPASTAVRATVRQWRDEAIMAGAVMPELPFAAGTVIVDATGPLRSSPGGRCVRIHAATSGRAAELLAPWSGRLQGAALAGSAAEALRPLLSRLGVTYLAPPGRLQAPDVATWHNGGVAPLQPFLD